MRERVDKIILFSIVLLMVVCFRAVLMDYEKARKGIRQHFESVNMDY